MRSNTLFNHGRSLCFFFVVLAGLGWPLGAHASSPEAYRVKDINIGSSSYPSYLTVAGERVFFYAKQDDAANAGLWCSDGTSSNTLELKLLLIDDPRYCDPMGSLNDAVYFSNRDATSYGWELCRSLGTVATTGIFSDVLPGESGSSPDSFLTCNGFLYFITLQVNTHELRRTDGSSSNTQLVHGTPSIRSYDNYDYTRVGYDRVAYTAFLPSGLSGSTTVWVTNGTQNTEIGTYGTYVGAISWLGLTGTADGKLFYVGDSVAANSLPALWCSDGTPAGTYVPKDLYDQYYGLPIYGLAATDSLAIFMKGLAPAGADLWRSDGTENGTYAITPAGGKFNASSSSSAALNPKAGLESVNVGAYLYFIANHPTGNGLWRTDGTAAGTVFLRAGVANLIADEGAAYFTALDGNGPGQAWYRNTPPSTEFERLGSIPATLASPTSYNRPVVGASAIFFVATGSEPNDGQELWALPLLSGTDAATWTAYE